MVIQFLYVLLVQKEFLVFERKSLFYCTNKMLATIWTLDLCDDFGFPVLLG